VKPATTDPYPTERRSTKRDRECVAGAHPAARHAAVTQVLTELYPKRRSAGVLAMLIWLTVAALSSGGHGVHVGHQELAQRFGIDRTTVTRRLIEWRDLRRLNRKRRGRQGSGVTWFAVTPEIVHAVAEVLRGRAKHLRSAAISARDIKRRNASRSQGSNLPQVAALRAAGPGVAAPSGRPPVAGGAGTPLGDLSGGIPLAEQCSDDASTRASRCAYCRSGTDHP
jgi:hypothetical protein